MANHFGICNFGNTSVCYYRVFVGYSVEKNPMISGSSIPQIEGCLKGRLKIIHSFKILVK